MRYILFCILFLDHFYPIQGKAQTFNLRIEMDSTTIDAGKAIEENENGYYFFTPWYYDLGLLNIGIHKLDYNGETIWKKSIGWDTLNLFSGYFGSTHRYSGGFAMGTSTSSLQDEDSALLMVFDENADTTFTGKINVDGEGIVGRVAIKIDDGFVISGYTSEGTGNANKFLLAKFDDLGELIWKKSYSDSNISITGFSLIQTPDGGFLMGGARIQAFNWDPMLIKTDSEGFEEWREYYGTEWSDYVAMVENTADGNYIFGSEEVLDNWDHSHPVITKMDTNGEIIWSKLYGDEGTSQAVNSLKLLPDGGFIACGVSNASQEDVMGFVLRTDADGNEYWFRKYYETEGNYCYLTDIIQDSQGYFVATGDLFPDPGISQDAWALRIDSCGCLIPGCGGEECFVGINNELKQNISIQIGPNPATHFINVYLAGINNSASLEVYNLQGQRIHQSKKVFDDTTNMIDVSSWTAGIYLVSLRINGVILKTERVEVLK